MTNFAFIMDLLKISAKKFSEIGFDKTRVSRWRSGKLRIMPNRYIAHKIAELFWKVDNEREVPILNDIISIWYPVDSCGTPEEKQKLLERFLTEKGQNEPYYIELREKCLGNIAKEEIGKQEPAVMGLAAARQRILDFFELISQMPYPMIIETVYPQGRGIFPIDKVFDKQLFEKYYKIFCYGHKIEFSIRSDEYVSNFAYSYNTVYNQKIDLCRLLDRQEVSFIIVYNVVLVMISASKDRKSKYKIRKQNYHNISAQL